MTALYPYQRQKVFLPGMSFLEYSQLLMVLKNLKFVEQAKENWQNKTVGIHPWKQKIHKIH